MGTSEVLMWGGARRPLREIIIVLFLLCLNVAAGKLVSNVRSGVKMTGGVEF